MQQPRTKKIQNWDNIKTIGLIFTVGDMEFWKLIQRFITAQESQGKSIFIIGFHPYKYEINYIFTHTKSTICHEKEDFSFMGLPKDGVIDQFLNNKYDLLIDSTIQPNFFGKYVTTLCNADLKVGYSNNDSESDEGIMEMYDMTIQGDGSMDFKNYIEQIVKYLKIIKK
ncbi:MAG: hypothetical protein J6X58_06050 [Bacteroidales bacterium]|nr:hypothetical protein [Bacteroidales bacterium]